MFEPRRSLAIKASFGIEEHCMNRSQILVDCPHSARSVILVAVVFFASLPKPFAQATRQTAAQGTVTVTKYINALQTRDFKTLIDLTSYYQQGVAKIKAGNPQVLWPKLIDEYYKSTIEDISRPTRTDSYMASYNETLSSMMGDPRQAIRLATSYFPQSCRWNISETRVVGQGLEKVYVTVKYLSWRDAPLVRPNPVGFVTWSIEGFRSLKETIAEFTVDSGGRTVAGIGRLAAGDAYFDDPLRIVNVRWTQLGGAALIFSAIGGSPPFQCSVDVGTSHIQNNCYRPGSSDFYVDVSPGSFPVLVRVSIADSTGRSDQVAVSVPRSLPGMAALPWARTAGSGTLGSNAERGYQHARTTA